MSTKKNIKPTTDRPTAGSGAVPPIIAALAPAPRPVYNADKKPTLAPAPKPMPRPEIKFAPKVGAPAGKAPRAVVYAAWLGIVAAVLGGCWLVSNWGGAIKIRTTSSSTLPMPEDEPLGTTTGDDQSVEYRESGKERLLAGDSVGALNDFTIAIEKNPSEALNYIYRGEVLMAGSNFEAAIQDFDAAVRLDPAAATAYYDRALANIKLERLDAAKSDLDLAIGAAGARASDIAPRDIYAKRAQVNLWLRNWADAENDYTAAIAQNFGEPDWNDYTGRAEARTNKSDFAGAITDYVSAVTIISERVQKTPDAKTRENMSRQAMGYFEKSGALRVKMGQMELALQDLQAAHTLAIALDDVDNKNRLQDLMKEIEQ